MMFGKHDTLRIKTLMADEFRTTQPPSMEIRQENFIRTDFGPR